MEEDSYNDEYMSDDYIDCNNADEFFSNLP